MWLFCNNSGRPPQIRWESLLGPTSICRALVSLAPLVINLWWFSISATVFAEAIFVDDFEGPLTSWRIHRTDSVASVLSHQRVRSPVRSGAWCETIRVSGKGGTYIYAAYDIGQAHVIDELSLSVWLRADRPGLQIAAQVVLPRTPDPKSGKPTTMLIYGDMYRDAGSWQQMFVSDIPQRVARQTRILRSGDLQKVDHREAYIDRILINVFGGQGVTNVWIDDLEIQGFVGQQVATTATALNEQAGNLREPSVATSQDMVRYRESLLTVGGRPFFPRIVQYQGESFAWLVKRGFNAIQLEQTPTAQQLHEAERLGLWLVCPPPAKIGGADSDHAAKGADVLVGEGDESLATARYGRVLAWHLGSDLTHDQLAAVNRKTGQLRSLKGFNQKPIACNVRGGTKVFGRLADVLIHRRSPIATTLEMTEYVSWLKKTTSQRAPGSVFWNAIQTQCKSQRLATHFDGAVSTTARPGATIIVSTDNQSVAYCQMRDLVVESLNAGARGLVFLSASPLDAPTPAAMHRARALELINLELSLIGQWLAASEVRAPVRCSHPDVHATAIQADHGQLVCPTIQATGNQFVRHPGPKKPVAFVIPGVATSARAYELTPVGLNPLQQQRVAGGTRVTVSRLNPATLLLLATSDSTTSQIARRVAKSKQRAAELLRQLATSELKLLQEIDRRLRTTVPTTPVARQQSEASELLKKSNDALRAQNYRLSYQLASRALQEIMSVQRSLWQNAVDVLGTPARLGSLGQFQTLPDAYAWLKLAAEAKMSDNRLAAGDMEDVRSLLAAGWVPTVPRHPERRTDAEITTDAHHAGKACLHLYASPIPKDEAHNSMESPPITVTCPELQLQEGEVIEIRGWVRTRGQVTHGDGLLVYDSIGGVELATRIRNAPVWQPITMYRRASQSGPVTLTISLQGLGDAWIDGLTIREVRLADVPDRIRIRSPALAAPRE